MRQEVGTTFASKSLTVSVLIVVAMVFMASCSDKRSTNSVANQDLVNIVQELNIKTSDLPPQIGKNEELGRILGLLEKSREKLEVKFEIPKNIAEGLLNGDFVRKGSTVVKAQGGEVVWLIKGTKVFKLNLAKAVSPATLLAVAVDFWSDT